MKEKIKHMLFIMHLKMFKSIRFSHVEIILKIKLEKQQKKQVYLFIIKKIVKKFALSLIIIMENLLKEQNLVKLNQENLQIKRVRLLESIKVQFFIQQVREKVLVQHLVSQFLLRILILTKMKWLLVMRQIYLRLSLLQKK